jgi:hypothetical protein
MALMTEKTQAQIRLIVKARPQLPKRYIWEIVYDDGNGRIISTHKSSIVYESMETAYEKGQSALADVRARHNVRAKPD